MKSETAEGATDAAIVEGLSYRPGRGFAISDASFRVPTGSFFGFLGANGSGKTTIIRLMLGLLRPDGGTVSILGLQIPRWSARALAHIGYVPEAPHLYPMLDVSKAIDYHAGFYATWDPILAHDLHKRMRLPQGRRVSALSKGELRKLMILLALAQRPRFLVLDEPTDGLDPVVRRDILDVLRDSVASAQTTVFMSSHLVHELETICDHIAVLDDGKLLAVEKLRDFKDEFRRVTVSRQPGHTHAVPTEVLRRAPHPRKGECEEWIVRGWKAETETSFDRHGFRIVETEEMDLESSFVELLRAVRDPAEPGPA